MAINVSGINLLKGKQKIIGFLRLLDFAFLHIERPLYREPMHMHPIDVVNVSVCFLFVHAASFLSEITLSP